MGAIFTVKKQPRFVFGHYRNHEVGVSWLRFRAKDRRVQQDTDGDDYAVRTSHVRLLLKEYFNRSRFSLATAECQRFVESSGQAREARNSFHKSLKSSLTIHAIANRM